MPKNTRNLNLGRLHGRIGQLAHQLTQLHFSKFCAPEGWHPPLNAYRLDDCIEVCVDLAGVEKGQIDLTIEPGRLTIRGNRPPPESSDEMRRTPVQILAMEIDCGPFERVIALPVEVDADRVTAEQRNGLLWIYMPLRAAA